jgi:hypothetical protein
MISNKMSFGVQEKNIFTNQPVFLPLDTILEAVVRPDFHA